MPNHNSPADCTSRHLSVFAQISRPVYACEAPARGRRQQTKAARYEDTLPPPTNEDDFIYRRRPDDASTVMAKVAYGWLMWRWWMGGKDGSVRPWFILRSRLTKRCAESRGDSTALRRVYITYTDEQHGGRIDGSVVS